MLMLSENVGVRSASASTFGLESSETLSWDPVFYLTGWVLHDILIFWAARRCASSRETGVVVSARWSSGVLRGRCPTVLERDIFRKVDMTSRADCARSKPDGSCFLWGPLKEQVYAVAPRKYRRSRGKTSSTSDNSWCQHVKACTRGCRATHCRLILKWTEVASNTRRNHWTPMDWSFDSLCHLTVMCALKTKRHRTYIVQYFGLLYFF
jgi:hypothetical protein